MANNIDTSLLRAFVAVAETCEMTSAGRLLNLTQAAVSQRVKRLEDMFRQQLFERDRRRLRLTAKGERLLAHAQRLVVMAKGRVVKDGIPAEVIGGIERYGIRQPCSVQLGLGIRSWEN